MAWLLRQAVIVIAIACLETAYCTNPEDPHVASALQADSECEAGDHVCKLSFMQLRGKRTQDDHSPATTGIISGVYSLTKRYDLKKDPHEEFDVVDITDKHMTHSCANYVDDGTTVLSRDGNLVLRVSSACPGGYCLNSGRVMSKSSYKYGIFTFSATVPKCNFIWPALWLLPENTAGEGPYGPWPCSGEIDVLETVHEDPWGAFNIVAGYGTTQFGCGNEIRCNACSPPAYCTSTTFTQGNASWYKVEEVECAGAKPSWKEHTFAMSWQPDRIMVWVDPVFSWDAQGNLVKVEPNPKASRGGLPSWKVYERLSTPTWSAVGGYMARCFPGQAGADAPFDIGMKIVMNVAIGGYGGAPCFFGSPACGTTCGAAVGSELVLSDISVWQST